MGAQAKKRLGFACFALLFLLLLGYKLWKARYGRVWDDEAFYLAIPWQMSTGDALLINQWNMAQMSGFLLYPLFRLDQALFPVEGLYLRFRLFYVALHGLTALFLFLRLREKSVFGAAGTALFYLAFSFSNMMCLSYNALCIALLLYAGVTLALGTGKAWEHLTAGLAFAGAVLCCPFLLLVYGVYTLAVLAAPLWKTKDPAFTPRGWLLFTSMCALLAALFFLRIGLSGNLPLLKETLPLILQDDTHPLLGPRDWLRGFYGAFLRANAYFKPVLFGSAALTALILFDRGRKKRRVLYLCAAALLALLFSLPYLLMYPWQNYLVFPLNILGFFAWLLCERRDRRLFALLFVPGMLYWACIDMSSDLGFSAIAGASAVNLPLSVLSIAEVLEELWAEKPAHLGAPVASLLCVGLYGLLLGTMVLAGTRGDAEGKDIADMNSLTLCGAQKGIYVTYEDGEAYAREYAALSPLREIPDGKVLFLSRNSLRYLEDGKDCASCDLWFSYDPVELGFARLRRYWELLPEKRPDYVYLNAEQLEKGWLSGFADFPHTETPVETGVILTIQP